MREYVDGIAPKVLVADDNENHCRVAKKLLDSDGYQVRVVHTGEVAIELFESWKPDLVILDSMLPNKCGIECLHHIKNHPALNHTRVVMCSARSDIGYVLSCIEAGASGYVFKPYEPAKFQNRIRHLLQNRHSAAS
ncbi:MAG: response regulator [Planctomycetes bacterium]|nr:response regulator [Planctomycetota bacterium]